jgi:hypothetical protein
MTQIMTFRGNLVRLLSYIFDTYRRRYIQWQYQKEENQEHEFAHASNNGVPARLPAPNVRSARQLFCPIEPAIPAVIIMVAL